MTPWVRRRPYLEAPRDCIVSADALAAEFGSLASGPQAWRWRAFLDLLQPGDVVWHEHDAGDPRALAGGDRLTIYRPPAPGATEPVPARGHVVASFQLSIR